MTLAHDLESERWQTARDEAIKRMDAGDFDVEECLHHADKLDRGLLKQDLVNKDYCLAGNMLERICLDAITESILEDE